MDPVLGSIVIYSPPTGEPAPCVGSVKGLFRCIPASTAPSAPVSVFTHEYELGDPVGPAGGPGGPDRVPAVDQGALTLWTSGPTHRQLTRVPQTVSETAFYYELRPVEEILPDDGTTCEQPFITLNKSFSPEWRLKTR